MTKPSPTIYLPLFERALEEEIGIAVPFSGCTREYLRNELYAARKASNNPRYDEIIIFAPNAPADKELWLCKKSVSLDE